MWQLTAAFRSFSPQDVRRISGLPGALSVVLPADQVCEIAGGLGIEILQPGIPLLDRPVVFQGVVCL